MADKRRVKKSIKQLQRVKTWQLVIILILVGLVSATFLRLNNIGMIERRTAVLNADKSGSYRDIANRLYDLQRYVSSHMNADPGRVALEGQYGRDAKAAAEAAANNTGVSGDVYNQASATCYPQALVGGWHWPDARYTNCINEELAKYPGTQTEPTDALPNVNLYYHEYVSPLWSPDFAGWSLVVCGVIVLIIIGRLISLGILKILLRKHYRSV